MAKKILIAEDSLTMRSLIVSTISAMGEYETVEAANGFEALRILPREKVDLIIMGIKARSDLEYMLVGSVAEKIFRRSPVPILSYRDQKSAERLRKNIHLD